MSARDLVGRPLVPFFDAHDNVNESLELESHAHEQLDVDARVWDKELGYFVYPTDAAPRAQHSMPIPINKSAPAPANDGASGSFGKMLLTPDMLSRSAPSASGSGMQQLHNTMGMTHDVTTVVDHDTRAATPRSASTKRGSRKNRSSTPNRNNRNKQRNANPQQPQASDGGSSGGEDRTASDTSDKAKSSKNKNKSDPGSAKKTRNKPSPQQAKDELSANGKWAWSAFQSSPDPKSLPLPPFVAGGCGSPGLGALPPPMDPPKIEERLDPPPMFAGRPVESGLGPPLPPPHPASLEHSMTQDLRRMLNIGS